MVSLESVESVVIVTPRDKMTTFVYQVVDEYRDAGYYPVGFGPRSEYDEMRLYTGVHLESVVDDGSCELLADVAAPLCVLILAWDKHDRVVSRVKSLRGRDDDVFVRYFPFCDVTR